MWHWILGRALCPTLPYRPAPCLSEVSLSHQARCRHAAAPARPSPLSPPPLTSWPALPLPLPPPPPSWWPWPVGFRYGSSPFRASPSYSTVQPSSVRDMNSGNIYSKITVHRYFVKSGMGLLRLGIVPSGLSWALSGMHLSRLAFGPLGP